MIRGVNEVREWGNMGMGQSFPVRRKRGGDQGRIKQYQQGRQWVWVWD